MTSRRSQPATQIRVRLDTRRGVDRIAEAHRLTLTDAAAVAVEAFEAMSPTQQRAVIERRGQRAKEATAA